MKRLMTGLEHNRAVQWHMGAKKYMQFKSVHLQSVYTVYLRKMSVGGGKSFRRADTSTATIIGGWADAWTPYK